MRFSRGFLLLRLACRMSFTIVCRIDLRRSADVVSESNGNSVRRSLVGVSLVCRQRSCTHSSLPITLRFRSMVKHRKHDLRSSGLRLAW